jgi:hypothetical protein
MVSVFMITAFRSPVWRAAVSLSALVACLIMVACDRVALMAPSGSTIVLSTDAQTLPLSGKTRIIAQVIEPAGTPPNKGTLVSFTTSLGQIVPPEAETDSGGRVAVVFAAGALSGTATISAVSGGVTTGTTGAVKIAVGAAGVATIGMTATPASIAPGGTSKIEATVSDTTGTVVAGVPVTFTTDTGSMNSSVVLTDANGTASALLTTSKTAKVTATAGVASTNGTATTAAPTASVTVTVEPLPTVSISVAGAATAQVNVPVAFTIVVNPGTGASTTITNVTVNFGDGTQESLGAATGTTTVQHVYASDGSKTARVTATDSNGGTTSAATIVFVQTQAPIVSLTIESSSTVAGATTVTFRATVTPSGTQVAQYVWNFGDGQSLTTTAPNNSVTHQYVTATLPKTATVTITTTTLQTASSSTTVNP